MNPDSRSTERLSAILQSMGQGTERWNEALPQIYADLRNLAEGALARTPGRHSIPPTSLVHEAWLRLAEREGWADRSHFLAVAATAMRGILVDRAREHRAEKRGGKRHRITLNPEANPVAVPDLDLLDFHDALEVLEGVDPRNAQIAELRVFGGMTLPEIATVLGVSQSTVESGWRLARAWLRVQLGSAE